MREGLVLLIITIFINKECLIRIVLLTFILVLRGGYNDYFYFKDGEIEVLRGFVFFRKYYSYFK